MSVPLLERSDAVDSAIADASCEAFFQLSGVGVVQVDVLTRHFLRANSCFLKSTGYSAEELERLSLIDLTHPDDVAKTTAVFDQMMHGTLPAFSVEKRLRRKDGSSLWVIVSASVVRDADGQPVRSVAMVQDVSERKQRDIYAALLADLQDASAATSDGAEIMQRLAGSISRALGVCRIDFVAVDDDDDTTPLHTYEWATVLSGAAHGHSCLDESLAEAVMADLHLGRPVTITDVRTDPRTASSSTSSRGTSCVAAAYLPHVSEGRCRFFLLLQHAHPHVWSRYKIQLLRDIASRVWLLLERNRAEKALRESEARLRRAMDIDTVGIVFFHLAGGIDDANDTFLRLIGYTREDLRLGLITWDRVIPIEWLAVKNLAMSELGVRGRTTPYENEYLRRDGGRWSALSCATLLSDDTGVVFIINITERKRAEALLNRDRDQLEQYVLKRTAELDAANGALRDEILERKRGDSERLALVGQLVAAQEDERRRISRELHDQVGQHLTALQLGLKSPRLLDNSPAANRMLKDMQGLTETIGKQIHDLALELRPTALDDLGLVRTMGNFLDDWAVRAGVEVDFHASGWSDSRLPAGIETTIYRIVCEALNNVLKHAGARRVSLIIERTEDMATAIIEDDGRGFDVKAVRKAVPPRLGLTGMRERAAMVRGEVSIESAVGQGTTIFVRIPLRPETVGTSHG